MGKIEKVAAPDFSEFPVNTVTKFERQVCLACVAEVFTKLLGVAAGKAAEEMKGYTPTVEELTAEVMGRPYFVEGGESGLCPYCGAGVKRQARITTYRIEGGKATDGARRRLVGSLEMEREFALLEEKATHDEAFFTWLGKMARVEEEEGAWLRKVTRSYLARRMPKVDWEEVFRQTRVMRRSQRLEEGWEIDSQRLFVAPALYWETIAVQYLVSRSHHGGGYTFEGRLTLVELVARLRRAGYLQGLGIHAHNPADVLEALAHHLAGGDGGVKMYYLVDRRNFLEQVGGLKIAGAVKKVVAKKKAAAKKVAKPVKKAVKKVVVKKVAKKAVKKKAAGRRVVK